MNKRARKEATQVELRQYRQQFQEAKQNEHKSWFDNAINDLIDMMKYPARNLVKGRWVLTVKRDKDGKSSNVRLAGSLRAFRANLPDQDLE